MRLEQLKYLVEVANQKSISKAARTLYISQPSLSKAISSLESELGTTLIIRHQRGISLTDDGAIVVKKAEKILAEVKSIYEVAGRDDNAEARSISIALPPLLCNDVFMSILLEAQRKYPQLSIIPRQKDTDPAIASLRTGETDLALISYSSAEREHIENACKEYDLIEQRIAKEGYYLVMSAFSVLATRTCIDFNEIADHQQVAFSSVYEKRGFTKPEVDIVYVPDVNNLIELLLERDCVSLFPRSGVLMCKEVRSGELVAIPVVNFSQIQYLSMLFNRNARLDDYTQLLINLITDAYREESVAG